MTVMRLLEVYGGHFRVTVARYMMYRVELVIWLIAMILQPVVFMAVWSGAATQAGGQVAGFTLPDIAAYFILAMLVNHATMAWVMWEWDSRVRHGELSYLLLRPSHVFHRDLGENLSFKLTTFPVMFGTAVALILTHHPAWKLDAANLPYIVPAFLLAFCLRFLLDWLAAMGAFFTTRVDALNVCYFFCLLLFSGQMAPMPFLPDLLRDIATFLPFRWCLDFPVRLIMGKLTAQEIWTGMCLQAVWTVIIALCCRIVWKKGLKNYTAVGL
jgi:ABC-2 type transport system permease protein